MATLTPRTQLADALHDLLPGFTIHRSVKGLDTLAAFALMIDQKSIEPYPPAPLSGYLVTFEVSVIAPGIPSPAVEDNLDVVMIELFTVLDTADILWTNATKGQVADRYIGYTVDLSVFSPKE